MAFFDQVENINFSAKFKYQAQEIFFSIYFFPKDGSGCKQLVFIEKKIKKNSERYNSLTVP